MKAFIGSIIRSSPLWGMIVNTIIAVHVAERVAEGRRLTGLWLLIAAYAVTLLMLAAWVSFL